MSRLNGQPDQLDYWLLTGGKEDACSDADKPENEDELNKEAQMSQLNKMERRRILLNVATTMETIKDIVCAEEYSKIMILSLAKF